ncbi:aromatic acid exporter family protein [Bacillus sp. EAC]|uniref:FUSC family protein n=1 Tax=Bacillus sp. EAC TaxID=1978338 RepID=UPI000B4536DC|nr:aromatic acid exporter family protein [Bacillus sp. EAC]
MRLGARVLKTGIAITLAIYSAIFFDLSTASIAGISAISAMKSSVNQSYQSLIEQLQANFIGALLAIIAVITLGNNPVIIGFTCIIVIIITLKLKLENTIATALVTVVVIMEVSTSNENFAIFTFDRISAVMIGVLAASFVNIFLMPPNYEKKLSRGMISITEQTNKLMMMALHKTVSHTGLKEDIYQLKEIMRNVTKIYRLYKEDRIIIGRKKKEHEKSRKIVLFRQMLLTADNAFDTLKALNRLEYEINSSPKEFQEILKNELTCLMQYHEHALMKLIGKVNVEQTSPLHREENILKDKLMKAFLDHHDLNDEEKQRTWLHLFQIVSAILEYSENVEHLNTLVDSHQTYHKEYQLQVEQQETM